MKKWFVVRVGCCGGRFFNIGVAAYTYEEALKTAKPKCFKGCPWACAFRVVSCWRFSPF